MIITYVKLMLTIELKDLLGGNTLSQLVLANRSSGVYCQTTSH